MPDGTEKDVRSVVDLVLQCSDITKELVQQAMRDYLQQNQDKSTHGKTSLRKLAEQSNGNLDSIEVSSANLQDFKEIAKKYDITYAIKQDSSTTPPTNHVFFATNDTDNFKRAFTEYAAEV